MQIDFPEFPNPLRYSLWSIPFACLVLFLGGCATGGDSPTTALVRGEITADEYLDAIKEANEEDRANAQFEFNKEPTRAYNTKTRQFEYVPEDTTQSWNEETQRWEFTPVE